MVVLRRVVDGAEEAGEIVEERVVPAADVDPDVFPVRRADRGDRVGGDRFGEVSADEPGQRQMRRLLFIHPGADITELLWAGEALAYAVDVADHALEVEPMGPSTRPSARVDQHPVQHVGVELAGPRHAGEGRCQHDCLVCEIRSREAEHVVEVGRTGIDVGED